MRLLGVSRPQVTNIARSLGIEPIVTGHAGRGNVSRYSVEQYRQMRSKWKLALIERCKRYAHDAAILQRIELEEAEEKGN
jgi:hypothetical protein